MISWLVLLQATLTIATAGPATAPEYLPLWVAQAEGYFSQEKLAVALEPTRSEASAAEALARGQADLAATSLDAALMLGTPAGAPPRLVFGSRRRRPWRSSCPRPGRKPSAAWTTSPAPPSACPRLAHRPSSCSWRFWQGPGSGYPE